MIQNEIVVPTLDGELLKIASNVSRTVLANSLTAELGVPFGIVDRGKDLIVTVSAYSPQHYLVRVKPDGKTETIADLSAQSGQYGALFGVTTDQNDYIVTLSTDVMESTSQLLRVTPSGQVALIATLSQYGNSFGVVLQNQSLIVAQSPRQIVRVGLNGDIKPIVDLKQAGFGLPFDLALWRDRIVATTNAGQVV